MKYKNKYLKLKNSIGGISKNKIKILIVVDVQECFLDGTMKNKEDDILNNYKSKLFTFLENNSNNYDVIIFTKDNHPIHHKSFGLFNPHCTEPSANYCGKRQKEIEELYNKSILKNEKSYEINLNNDKENKKGKTLGEFNGISFEEKYRYRKKIQLKPEFLKNTTNILKLEDLNLKNNILLSESNGIDRKFNKFFGLNEERKPYIIRINKGELCNFDAYGAFAYHVSYDINNGTLQENDIVNNPDSNKNPNWLNLSTGLAEFLLDNNNYEDNINREFEIDVCGLVTNICVVSTCVTGCKVFNALDFNNYKFKILNQYCLNLLDYNITRRNTQKIINDNNLQEKITISDDNDVTGFNPKTEKY